MSLEKEFERIIWDYQMMPNCLCKDKKNWERELAQALAKYVKENLIDDELLALFIDEKTCGELERPYKLAKEIRTELLKQWGI